MRNINNNKQKYNRQRKYYRKKRQLGYVMLQVFVPQELLEYMRIKIKEEIAEKKKELILG